MQWYKHDTNANSDAKLKRVRMKYGMEGYGLYWYCLELIAANIDQNNLSFELEHDSEIISHDTGIHYERVQEMMEYMVGLGLFENRTGSITCLKLLNRLDQSMTGNPKMRKLISSAKTALSHDSVMTVPDSVMQDKNRIDKRRIDPKKGQTEWPFDLFWKVYPKKRKKKTSHEIWKRKKLDPVVDLLIADVKNRIENDSRWTSGYVPDPTTYLNQERWDDELEDKSSSEPNYTQRMAAAARNLK